eukprot:jgi/Undpi1/11560/HiC_scaffold_30.g13857.m1
MRCHHRGSSAATQQEQEQQRHQWRRHLLYGPMLIALAILDFSAASRWTNVPASPQSSRGAIQRVAPARSALVGRLGVRVRGGAIQSVEEEGEAQEALASTLSEGGLAETVKTLLSKFLDVVGTLLGTKGGGGGGGGGGGLKAKAKASKAKRSKTSGAGFKEAFETKYGKSHPNFNEKSFAEATEHAWELNRLCLVYIAADRGRGSKEAKVDDAICKAFADEQVADFVDSNFVVWVPGGKSSAQRAAASAAAAKRVGARSLPFLGVVNSASLTDKMSLERKLKRSTVALHHCNPPPSPDQMISWMTRVLELKKELLETELAEQQRLRDEINIHTERVEGYSKSLIDDAQREALEKEEEAERARLEEEEKKAQEIKEAKEREDVERREKKATELGQEPPESALKGYGVAATFMLRLADGSRVRRRFLRSDTMGKVLDWADVQGVDLESQRLSSTFPKASFSYPDDAALTIAETDLGKQTLLFVEQKPTAAAPVPGADVTTDSDAAGTVEEGVNSEL